MGITSARPRSRTLVRLAIGSALVVLLATAGLPSPATGSTTMTAACTVRLRRAPSTTAAVRARLPRGAVVTVAASVSGGHWSTTCGNAVAGNRWYRITAVNGRSTRALYGVAALYGARGMFRARLRPALAATPSPVSASTASPSSSPTSSPSSAPSASPDPFTAPTPGPVPFPTAAPAALRWGLLGGGVANLAAERSAGITAKLVELSWRAYEPVRGSFDATYVARKRAEIAAIRSAGFAVILGLGVQYEPPWLLALPHSGYVDQYGDTYADTCMGCQRANFVWNPDLRAAQGVYLARVFTDLGTDFAAVRVGGGHFGELGYPTATWGGRQNTYWAFDAHAAASNPVPGWKPGEPSPNGEAGRFLEWYLEALDRYAQWQVSAVRASYPGVIMLLEPSFGIRPGQAAKAVAASLAGTTSAEVNGEIQRGYDFARHVSSIRDPDVWVATTWLDCPYGDDGAADPGAGSPARYLAWLAEGRGLRAYGENTGRGSRATLEASTARARRTGLAGLAWFDEAELLSGSYATLADMARVIAANP